MKQPDEPPIGAKRKTLPARRARKVQKPAAPPRKPRNILDKDVEKELVRVFGEK